jgi:dihydropyrimidine dehydrogenase (NAD+) subunit PreA
LVDERGAELLKVDERHCVGCNLCSMVCPVDECITMVRVDDGETTHTWRERQLSLPS